MHTVDGATFAYGVDAREVVDLPFLRTADGGAEVTVDLVFQGVQVDVEDPRATLFVGRFPFTTVEVPLALACADDTTTATSTFLLAPADAPQDGAADQVEVVLGSGRLPADRGRDWGIFRTSIQATTQVVWREVGGADAR